MANETRVKGKWHLMRIDDECKLSDKELREFIEDLNDLTSHWEYEIVFTTYDEKEEFLIEGEFSALGCDAFVDNLEWLTDDSDGCNRRLYNKYEGKTNFIIFFQYDEFDDAMGTFNKEALSSLIFLNTNYAPVLGNGCYVVKPEVRELLKKEIIDSEYFDNSIVDSIFYERCGKPYQEDLTKLDDEDKYLAILFKMLDLADDRTTNVKIKESISAKVTYGQVYDLETGRYFVSKPENRDWLDGYVDLYEAVTDFEKKTREIKISEGNLKEAIRLTIKKLGGKDNE